jgi:hypothetical protein
MPHASRHRPSASSSCGSTRRPSIRRFACRSIAVCVGLLLACGPGQGRTAWWAQEPTQEEGRSWAILVGVEKYRHVAPLKYTTRDVTQLATTLRERCRYAADCLLTMTDGAADSGLQPTRENLQQQLTAWLQKPGAQDTLIVYFSGHGFRDPNSEKMYLAPLDCDLQQLDATGISVAWLRDAIKGCPARFKLLVLDTCHAGSEKSLGGGEQLVPTDLGESFKDVSGVVTLASCKAREQSQLWDEKQQSLFSYWLNLGLRGHADLDFDGAVDVDELYKYVDSRVRASVKARFPIAQTPARIIPADVTGVQVVVRPTPPTLRQALTEMAEVFSVATADQQLRQIGVLEFKNDTEAGELLHANFGLLGRYCAEFLEAQMARSAADQVRVIDRETLQRAVTDQGFSLADLGSPAALQTLSAKLGGKVALVDGTLSHRVGREMNWRCKLRSGDTGEVLEWAGGTVVLSLDEWAMIGRSVAVTPADRVVEHTPSGDPVRPVDDQVVDRLDQRAEGPHPLQDKSFPLRVKIKVGGKERAGEFRGNELFVPLRKDEVYEVWVENHTGRLVLLRLLVDGLNTLPEKHDAKGVATYIIGKRVNLDEARHWLLRPEDGKEFAIRGFVTDVGPQGKLREFKVVDAAESLAARRQVTVQIGVITAAFYAPGGEDRGLGTAPGRLRDEKILEGEKVKVGNVLAVIHVRYGEAE